jgi:hypothetical protein
MKPLRRNFLFAFKQRAVQERGSKTPLQVKDDCLQSPASSKGKQPFVAMNIRQQEQILTNLH